MADVIEFTKKQLVYTVMAVIYVISLAAISFQLYQQSRSNDEQQAFFECERKRSDVLELRDQLWVRTAPSLKVDGPTPQETYRQIISENPLPTC